MDQEFEKVLARLGGVRPCNEETFYPVPAKELMEIESLLGAEIPGPYRDFLLDVGAAFFNNAIDIISDIELPGDISLLGISTIFGSQEDGVHSLMWQIDTYKGRIPDVLLPIADNLFGDIYCMCYKGEDRGKIYFWDHENEYDPEMCKQGHIWQNVYLIAMSFYDLFAHMVVVEE